MDTVRLDGFEQISEEPRGEVKSQGTALKIDSGSEFALDFSPAYQVHGRLGAASHANNREASLVVLKFRPIVPNAGHKILRLRIKLHVVPPHTSIADDDDRDEDDDSLLYGIDACQPAGDGVQSVGEGDKRNITKTKELSAGVSVSPPAVGQIFNTDVKKSQMETSEKCYKLTIENRISQFKIRPGRRRKDVAEWHVQAANKDEGVGDSLTVAVLVTRPPASRFRFDYFCEAYFGRWSDNFMTPSQFFDRKKWSPLPWEFQSNHQSEEARGDFAVDTADLRAAIKDTRFLKNHHIGHHIPEQVEPVTYHGETTTMREAEIPKLLLPNIGGNKDRASDELAKSSPLAVLPSNDLSNTERIIKTDDDGQTDVVHMTQDTIDATLPDSTKISTGSSQKTHASSGSKDRGRRSERLRMMAALYEHLAILLREEARDILLPDETETAYVDDILDAEKSRR